VVEVARAASRLAHQERGQRISIRARDLRPEQRRRQRHPEAGGDGRAIVRVDDAVVVEVGVDAA